MIRAVIDTNVLVSGPLAPAGNEALVVLAIHHGLLRPCFSVEILHEYAEVLARPKFAFPSQEVAAALAMFHDRGELIVLEGPAPILTDPGDAKFVHCAEAARAEFIVTGNKRHLPPVVGATRVVSAGELLDRITQEI